MNEIRNESEFNRFRTADRVLVLFYASWCPFSQRFLPVFEEYSRKNSDNCVFARIDDEPVLCDKYSIEFYPTVICFEKGTMTKRVDSKHGEGLSRKQFEEFVRSL